MLTKAGFEDSQTRDNTGRWSTELGSKENEIRDDELETRLAERIASDAVRAALLKDIRGTHPSSGEPA